MKTKPDLSFWKLWNLSFGFFGAQIAYALQSANVSRIFATLGADPHDLSYFWILPPLMGLIVQPIVGTASDRTWNRFGRRLPYLIGGALIAVLVMCLLPNAGSFGLTVSSAILVGLFALMLLDTSINMAMQPFKMLVGDMVNEKQKGVAYSIQSFLCNAGSIVGYIFPFLLTWIGFRNTAAAGVIPQTVVFSFYFGAAILLVIYSLVKIKEWPPKQYAEYNGGAAEESSSSEKSNLLKLLLKAPSTFWTVGLVQFFCWFAFLFMWTYTNGTVAKNAFDCPETTTINAIVEKQNGIETAKYSAKYILTGDSLPVVMNGKAAVAGFTLPTGEFIAADNIEIIHTDIDFINIKHGGLDIKAPTAGVEIKSQMVVNGLVFEIDGVNQYSFGTPVSTNDATLLVNGSQRIESPAITLADRLSRLHKPSQLLLADIYTHDPATGELFLDGVSEATVAENAEISFNINVVLNTESPQYNDAGNWVGILFAVQAIGSVLWAIVLPMFRSRKFSYSLSLILGAVGFISAGLITDPYLMFISFVLIGCAWSAMLAWPFTILTNSLKSGNIGAYLGLFNCSICIPQIIGALVGGWILSMLGTPDQLAPQHLMMIIAGISLLIGSVTVVFIKENKA